MKIYKKLMSVLIWFVAAIVLWEISALFLDKIIKDPFAEKKLPYLHNILLSFSEYGENVFAQAFVSFGRAGEGFLWGGCIGILLALIMSLSSLVEKMILPYLLISQMIPILGLAPIIFGLVKDLDTARIVISAYITFFPVSISLLSGLKAVDSDKRMLMSSFAVSKFSLYKKLMIPFSVPYLFTGLKMAAPMAVTASILVDTLSAKDGIGYIIIVTLYGGGTTGQFWPAVLVAGFMGVISFALVALVEIVVLNGLRLKKGA